MELSSKMWSILWEVRGREFEEVGNFESRRVDQRAMGRGLESMMEDSVGSVRKDERYF